jgi:hypothetical protein
MNPNKLDSHDSNGEISCFAKKKQLITSGMTHVVMISIVKVTIIILKYLLVGVDKNVDHEKKIIYYWENILPIVLHVPGSSRSVDILF